MEKPIVYTLEEAAKIIGLGKTRIYQELNSGRLAAKKAGRRTLVLRESIEEWLAGLSEYHPGQKPALKAVLPQGNQPRGETK